MADEFVPATEDVRESYTYFRGAIPTVEHEAEFDRWLAAHDAETAARAWDEAVSAMRYEDGTPVELVANVTPYREGDPT